MSEQIDRRTFASLVAVTAIGTAAASARIAAAQPAASSAPPATQPAAGQPATPPVQPPVDATANPTPESWMTTWLDELQAQYPVPALTPEQRTLVLNDLMDQARLGKQLASIPLHNSVAPGVWLPQLAK